jgi:hypothetical protein
MIMKKTETAKTYSQILSKIAVGKPVVNEDREFLLGLLTRTSKYGGKAAQPDVKIMVRMVEIGRGRRVRMFSLEGDSLTNPGKYSKIPVSKAKVLEELFPSKTKKDPLVVKVGQVRQALRMAVDDQIKEFRNSVVYPTVCVETGGILTKRSRTHVDHYEIPFVQLVEDWLNSLDLYYSTLVLVGPPTAKRLLDESLTKSWGEYHREFARLALVDASANMKKGAGNNWEISGRISRT